MQIATVKLVNTYGILEVWKLVTTLPKDEFIKPSILHLLLLIRELGSDLNDSKLVKLKNEIIDSFLCSRKDIIDSKIMSFFSGSFDKSSFSSKLNWTTGLLADASIYVIEWALKETSKLLKEFQKELHAMILCENVEPIIGLLLQRLLNLFGLPKDSCKRIHYLAVECIGYIGAIDPDRLGLLDKKADSSVKINLLDSPDKALNFSCGFISTKLIPLLKSSQDHKAQDRIGFCIQEILKICKFSEEDKANDYDKLWSKFSKENKSIVVPYLSSKYMMSLPASDPLKYPLSKENYSDWCLNWIVDLIYKIPFTQDDNDPHFDSSFF